MKMGAERLLDNLLTFLALSYILSTIILLMKSLFIGLSLPSVPSDRDISTKVALACAAKQITSQERIVKFDTDAKPIGVDNQCSTCISPYMEDFIGPLEDTNKTIKDFAGARTNNPKIGTLRWQWLDDSGKMHTFEIPNSYYVPACELRLLSPQHWAQTRTPVDRATTQCITSSVNVYLRWTKGDESYELTLPLNKKGSNLGTLYSHPGYNKYDLFCQAAEITIAGDKNPIAIPANFNSDDEDNEESNTELQIGPPPIIIPKGKHWNQGSPSHTRRQPV